MERLLTTAQMERAAQVAGVLFNSLILALPDRAGGLYLSTARTQARVAELARILGTGDEPETCKKEG